MIRALSGELVTGEDGQHCTLSCGDQAEAREFPPSPRLCQMFAHRARSDLQCRTNLSVGLAALPQRSGDVERRRSHDRGPATLATPGHRSLQSGPCALRYERAFKLAEAHEDVENELAARRLGLDGFGERPEPDSSTLKVLDHREEVLEIPPEPVVEMVGTKPTTTATADEAGGQPAPAEGTLVTEKQFAFSLRTSLSDSDKADALYELFTALMDVVDHRNASFAEVMVKMRVSESVVDFLAAKVRNAGPEPTITEV